MAGSIAKSEVVDRDLGYARIVKELGRIAHKDPGVLIGIRQGAEAPAGVDISMVELGSVHEFGSLDGTIPERSFLRSTADAYQEKYADRLGDAIGFAIDGWRPLKTSLGRIGAEAVSDVQGRITRREIHQDLSEATIRRKTVGGKKGDVALVDTGHLLKVIDWKTEGV